MKSEAEKESNHGLQEFGGDEFSDFHARGFEKRDLLGENAGAAEGDAESGAGEREQPACGGEGGAAARAFEQAVRQRTRGGFRTEQGEERGEQKDGNFHQFCVFQCPCDDAEIGDEPSDAKNGNDRALYAFRKHVIAFLRRNGQFCGIVCGRQEGCAERIKEEDGTKVRGEQDPARADIGEHGVSDASEQEHRAGRGADDRGARRIFFADETRVFHVEQRAAADGVTGKRA